MGRVVGDGMIYFYIQDIAVKPEHQSQGIGRRIMDAITAYLKEYAPEKAFVGLFAAQGKETFYNRYGLNRHDGMTGMFGVIHGGEIK
jgi:ribosomal protein S18 acetylase RimI-like enzyme